MIQVTGNKATKCNENMKKSIKRTIKARTYERNCLI